MFYPLVKCNIIHFIPFASSILDQYCKKKKCIYNWSFLGMLKCISSRFKWHISANTKHTGRFVFQKLIATLDDWCLPSMVSITHTSSIISRSLEENIKLLGGYQKVVCFFLTKIWNSMLWFGVCDLKGSIDASARITLTSQYSDAALLYSCTKRVLNLWQSKVTSS